MDQYEDLKKFKEKAQIKSMRFVDFTKQNREVNTGQWSIVHQLSHDDTPADQQPAPSPATSPGQHPFHSPAETAAINAFSQPLSQSLPPAQPNASRSEGGQPPEQHPLNHFIDSPPDDDAVTRPGLAHAIHHQPSPLMAQSLPLEKPAETISRHIPRHQGEATAHNQRENTPLQVTPARALAPQATKRAGGFSHLFTHHSQDLPELGKETPLLPLLKRIATCR